MKRRRFIQTTAMAALSGGVMRCTSPETETGLRYAISTLTSGPQNHFFGYYGICPWNGKETKILSLQSPFQDHMPEPNEPAVIGLVDAKTGGFSPITQTRAWNFQQGAMLHWHPAHLNSKILFNDREKDELVSVIYDLKTSNRRVLPRPVNAMGHQGKHALCLTYGRMGRLRKVVGYAGTVDPNPNDPHPDNDGVFLMDLETGETRLIVSIKQVYEMLVPKHPELKEKHMWFNHVVFNPSDTRFFFLARIRQDNGRLETGMFAADTDGGNLTEVVPYGSSVSHFDWRSDTEIVATFIHNTPGRAHFLLTDGDNHFEHLGGGMLDFDGHCSFGPDKNWMVTDRNLDETLEKSIILYNLATREYIEMGRINMRDRRFFRGDLRCDLHPRWNRSGNQICFDGIANDGTRQLHLVNLNLVA